MDMYAATKEMKTMVFRINSQNIEQEFGIQVTFIIEIKPQKERFLAKKPSLFGDFCVDFEPPLGWECAYVWHDIRTEKESIYGK